MSATFERLADRLPRAARAGEVIFANWRAEDSDFVRFNDARLRQAGSVARAGVELRLIDAGRVARCWLIASGDPATDMEAVDGALVALRETVAVSPVDPWLIFDRDPRESFARETAAMPDPSTLAWVVRNAAGETDLVGFWMAGTMAVGLASSLGHRHYHESAGWSFDHSLFTRRPDLRDKAVKNSVAGTDWDASRVAASITASRERLTLLTMPPRTLAPGRYRAWLAPRACADLLAMLNWGGFSGRAQRTGQSPLALLHQGQREFDPRLSVAEDLAQAGAPRFQSDGFVRPDRVALIDHGRFANALVSPRSAREFGLAANGADGDETAQALAVAPGELDDARALDALGTGLAISNLWYLNFSDRASCRVTGMTRFATLWIENGRPVAPVEVMRFDDSLFDLFGTQLESLGSSSHWLPNTDSYDWREFGGVRAPSLLVRGLNFTL